MFRLDTEKSNEIKNIALSIIKAIIDKYNVSCYRGSLKYENISENEHMLSCFKQDLNGIFKEQCFSVETYQKLTSQEKNNFHTKIADHFWNTYESRLFTEIRSCHAGTRIFYLFHFLYNPSYSRLFKNDLGIPIREFIKEKSSKDKLIKFWLFSEHRKNIFTHVFPNELTKIIFDRINNELVTENTLSRKLGR